MRCSAICSALHCCFGSCASRFTRLGHGKSAKSVGTALVAALLWALPAWSQASSLTSGNTVPFSSGEILKYRISWRLSPAGEGRIQVERHSPTDGPPYWQATVQAASTGVVSRLYSVNDTLISRFANGAMCSQFLLKTLHEGTRHRSIRIDFQKERQMAVPEESDPNQGRLVRQAENSIPECAYDLVSALFYVRSLPLEVGRTFQVPVNDGSKTLPIQVEVQAREEVRTGVGDFLAIRVEPTVVGGYLFRGRGRLHVWFSDDPQRLPVQIRARLSVGTVTAVLETIEHQ